MRRLTTAFILPVVVAALAIGSAALLGSVSASDGVSLSKLEQTIAKRFPTVESVTPQQFQTDLQRDGEIVVLDVRETGEFNVSHLASSEQVSPGISKPDFLKRFAGTARGKTFVLYCSVGYRSSKLAASIQKSLKQAGARAVYNLQGGIFAWHNGAKPLVKDGDKATKLVHPYSEKWGRYLINRNLTSYGKSSGWRNFN